MIKKLSLLSICFILAACFTGCSKDDDPENNSSSLTINGEKTGKFIYTLCEITHFPSYLGGGSELALEAHFDYADEGIISFDMGVEGIASLSQIEAGTDITDDIEINKFYSMTGVVIGREDYEITDGSAVIESVSSKAVVVRFKNFRFIRELINNETEFTLNGTISYTIND